MRQADRCRSRSTSSVVAVGNGSATIRAVAHILLFAFAIVLASLAPAFAASGEWIKGDYVQARLIAAVAGTGTLPVIPMGIEVTLDDGWKTYWRAPGDAGLPPSLTWDGSLNLKSATLLYPSPRRMTLLGLQTFGYKHHVIFPLDVSVAAAGQPLDAKFKLDLLVCAKLCVPRRFALQLALPAGPATADPEAQLIAKARAAVPTGSAASGLTIASVEEVANKGVPALEIKATAHDPFVDPDVIVEVDPPLAFGLPVASRSLDGRTATFLVPLAETLAPGAKLSARAAKVTLVDGERALEQPVSIAQGASAIDEAPSLSFVALLGIALLGGLILNVMPCVLPVLSLKLLSVVAQGGRAPAAIRAGFLATASGIVASFIVIAVALVGVKAAGRTIGWGIQFQEPAFIAALAVLVCLFAAHLWGLFEVAVPRFVSTAAGRRLGPDTSLIGHFATGAFATLLATPCSAPFLGTAIGFALAGDPLQMIAIFFAMGIGLALPYLAVAAVPHWAARLPKPGRWMVLVKQAMAIPLIGTALWLLAILSTQVNPALAGGVGVILVALLALLVVRKRLPEHRIRLASLAAIGLVLVAIALPDVVAARNRTRAERGADVIAWQDFDRNTIKSLVSQGRTVFVDVTADWCLTCQANKRLVLADGALADRLNKTTVAMQADWTRPDPGIAAFLAAYGRYGIPFNIVYGPGAPSGVVLPELFSTGDVGAALDKASGEPHRAERQPANATAVN